jgi:monofunctional glycosyltransferase
MPRTPWIKTKERIQIALLVAKQEVLASVGHALARPWLLFQRLCFAIGFGVLAAFILSAFLVYSFLRSLPAVDRMSFEALTEIGKKRVIERLENRSSRYRWTSLRDISREFLYSVVVSEDATFFEHEGFNIEMMLSSLAENLKEGKHAYGASTISQQVAKNLFLTNEKTYIRKLKEFLITRRLEKRFKKNELIEVYLNVAEFGPDVYGAYAASHEYFKVNPSDINAAQGAFIALMLPSPKRNYFSIYQNKNLTKVKTRRIERVLRDMLYEEYLSEPQYQRYVRFRYFPETSPRRPARTGP